MSLWSDFTSIGKNVISGILGSNPATIATQAGASMAGIGIKDPRVAAAAGVAAQTQVKNKLEEAGIATQDTSAMKAFDPVLYAAEKAEKYVFSPLIARPISTINLLSDPDSKLYQAGKFDKGFQFSDIQNAYNRTGNEYKIVDGEKVLAREGVSLGQSFVKNPFTLLGFAESKLLEANGIDTAGIDLWNDQDIQDNFVDNTLGKWVTGLNDFVIKNVAINAAFSGAATAAKAGAVRAGLTTKIKATDVQAMPKLEKDMYDHIDFTEGNGGTQTVIGQDIIDLAASENIIDITRIVKKHSYNPNLPDLIKNTKDPRVVADFLLADKAYGPAIDRLTVLNRTDDLWVAGDATAVFRGEYIKNGKLPDYTPEQTARWMKAFDDSIAKDPKQKEIYDAFLSQELDDAGSLVTVPNFQGKLSRPMEPKGLQGAAGAARSKSGKLKTAVIERDFTNPELGTVVQTVLGGGLKYPTTVLIRHLGTFMPKGIVTNSGLRPLDGITELIAVFDDVPLFRDGTKTIVTHDLVEMTVSEYRRNLITRFTEAKTDGLRSQVIKEANKEIAKTISYSRGFFDDQTVSTMVDDLMQDVYSVHGNLRANGHAMDPTGVRVTVGIKTQRQLQNSEPMLPLGDLDRMILKSARMEKGPIRGGATKVKQNTATAAKTIFESANRIFSVAQLYRFSYIPKNSVFEPLLAATLAEGSKFTTPLFTQASKSVIRDGANFILRNVEKSKTLLPSAKKEIQREIKAISEQYNRAIINRDQAYATYDSMFADVPGVSPATKRDWADHIKGALLAAEKDVAALEARLNTYTIEYGAPINVPSIYSLRARIETLKAAGSVRYASEIRSAEITLQKAVGEINTLAPELNAIDADIALKYKVIGDLLEQMGPLNLKKADLFSVAEARYAKQPILPETSRVQLSNGQTLEFDSFASRNGLGSSYMSEIANNSTRTMEMLGNKATVGKINTIMSRSPKNITRVTDPAYFDELAYVVNNHMRGDILVDRILSGQSRQQIIDDWATTPQARYYLDQMGRAGDDVVAVIDEQFTYVNRYLPTIEAKTAAATREVGPEQLRGLLGDKLDQMVPIQPLDIQYANPTTLTKNISTVADALLANAWKGLMKPENLIREVWGTSRHNVLVAERAEALVARGFKMDLATLNKVHHSAAVQVASEVSKVFYTIPRQHRALYMARGLATFPNAAASGIYRYSRFAATKTKRFAGFLNNYYSLYGSFGVDEYGNPVDDPMKAQYLLIPGTKELGLNNGKGVIVNARATNYVANFPGASYLVPVFLSTIYAGKPNTEDEIKKTINSTVGRIPGYSYEEMFPYGIEQNPLKQIKNTFTPAWARNLATALKPSETDKMFVDSWISEAQLQMITYEMNKEKDPNFKGPMPTEESIMAGAKNIYWRKFRTQFFSILGTPQVVQSQPASIFQDFFFMAYNNALAKGETSVDAWKIAEKQVQSHMLKTTGAELPMDRLFASSQDSIGITPSVKAYDRIWEDFPELATALRQVDPSVVPLMVADLPKEYSPQINKFLNSTTARLPDGTPVNSALKTPQLVEEEIQKSRMWSAYTEYKDKLNEAAKKAGYASYLSIPEFKDALRAYAADTLSKESNAWYVEYQKNATKGNAAWIQSQGLYTVVNNKQFMKKFGKTQFWQQAKTFVEWRNQYAAAYAAAPTGQKAVIKNSWAAYLAETQKMWDPGLQKIITRYFENDNMRGNK